MSNWVLVTSIEVKIALSYENVSLLTVRNNEMLFSLNLSQLQMNASGGAVDVWHQCDERQWHVLSDASKYNIWIKCF